MVRKITVQYHKIGLCDGWGTGGWEEESTKLIDISVPQDKVTEYSKLLFRGFGFDNSNRIINMEKLDDSIQVLEEKDIDSEIIRLKKVNGLKDQLDALGEKTA